MNPTRQILFNGGVLSALFAMQSLTFSFGFSRLILFYAAAALMLWFANRQVLRSLSGISHTLRPVLTGFAIAFVLMHIVRESFDYGTFVGDPRAGLKLGLVELATSGTLMLLAVVHLRKGGALDFLATVAVAISAYVALNLVLEMTGWLQGSIEQGFQSRYAEGFLRWMPPLTKSNGLFSILNRYALSLGLLFLLYFRRDLSWLLKVAVTVGIVVTLYAGVLLEHRAAFVPVFVAPIAYWVTGSRRPALLAWVALLSMVVVPVAVASGLWETVVVKRLPDAALELAGDPATVYDLSGREYIYSYGVKYLTSSQMSLFGDGPVFRDSLPGFRDESRLAYRAALKLGAAPQTFGFHNGFLDISIAYGPICGALFLAFLWSAIAALGRAATAQSRGARLGLTNLAVLLSVNVLDGGFSDFNIIFVTLLATVLAVARGTEESARAALVAAFLPSRARAAAWTRCRELPSTDTQEAHANVTGR